MDHDLGSRNKAAAPARPLAATVFLLSLTTLAPSAGAVPLARPDLMPRGLSLARPVAVFGADERSLIANAYPQIRKRLGLLVHDKTQSVCTAFCLAPDIIATAGHCVVGTASQTAGDPAGLHFRRDIDKGRGVPVKGAAEGAAHANIMTGAHRLNTRPPINATSDWAFLRLQSNACPDGGLRLSTRSALDITAEAAAGNIYHIAYHRDLAHWKLAVGTPCAIVPRHKTGDPVQMAIDFERVNDLLLHTCDTEAASSGSPLLIDGKDGPEVVGINVGTYVRSRVIAHDGQIVQRLDSELIANTALVASPLIASLEAFSRAEILSGAADIRALQTHLAGLGMEPGPADGHYGPLTRRAIEMYEERAGLPVTGLATRPLLLRLDAATAARAAR